MLLSDPAIIVPFVLLIAQKINTYFFGKYIFCAWRWVDDMYNERVGRGWCGSQRSRPINPPTIGAVENNRRKMAVKQNKNTRNKPAAAPVAAAPVVKPFVLGVSDGSVNAIIDSVMSDVINAGAKINVADVMRATAAAPDKLTAGVVARCAKLAVTTGEPAFALSAARVLRDIRHALGVRNTFQLDGKANITGYTPRHSHSEAAKATLALIAKPAKRSKR
jgi:hypothetical protein